MSERLRLLVTADAVGGVWTYSLDLARALAPLGIDTWIALVGPAPSAAQRETATRAGVRLVETGLPLDWVSDDPAAIDEAARALARLATRTRADLVQLCSAALAAEAAFPVPVVAVQHSCVASWWDAVHGTAEMPDDLAWRAERVQAGLQAADAVVAPTAAFGEKLRRRYALAEAPVAVHNGRAPLTLPEVAAHDFAFTAGRLWDAGKNVATLDAAAARIAVPVHAAGPILGPNGAGVDFANLHCLGELDEAEIGRWLAARPVFVSTALYEPFGLAVLEAAMAGCPLVLSDIPTFRELWDGAATFLPPTDDAAFAAAIADLVGDDFARRELGGKAKARAARYTPAAMAAGMARVYRTLLGAGRSPAPQPEAEAVAA